MAFEPFISSHHPSKGSVGTSQKGIPRPRPKMTEEEAREAHKRSNKRYRQKHNAHLNAKKRDTRKRGTQTDRDRAKRYAKNNPEKVAAHALVRKAIQRGELSRGVCEICGNTKVQAHHDDYTKPLDVRWLCVLHHRRLHAE